MTIGIDEVGRGSVAGPVTVAGVCLGYFPVETFSYSRDKKWKDFPEFKLVKDSKKLSKKNREKVFELVQTFGIQNIILSASNKLIDEYGIGVCLSHLTQLAILKFSKEPITEIIIDGKIKILKSLDRSLLQKIILENKNFTDPINKYNQNLFNDNEIQILTEDKFGKIKRQNKADDQYLSVALASSVAKVFRDNYMTKIGQEYPDFQWGKNKGYATQKHLQAIKQNPQNDYLRRTFLSKYL